MVSDVGLLSLVLLIISVQRLAGKESYGPFVFVYFFKSYIIKSFVMILYVYNPASYICE